MEVKKYTAYHLSLLNYDLDTQWPYINREYENENRKRTEEIIERARAASTISNSRTSSLFVCSTMYNVRLWAAKKFKGVTPYLYTLELSGELSWLDATFYEEVFNSIDH